MTRDQGAPLLARPFAEQTRESFLAHVSSLRRLPTVRAKLSRPKKPKLTGRFTDAGTLKRPGAYEVRFGELSAALAFAKTKGGRSVSAEAFTGLVASLRLDADLLRKFLAEKKITLRLDESAKSA